MTAYVPLTDTEKNAHLTHMPVTVGRSGIYPSGEAHFFDPIAQDVVDVVGGNNTNTSIFQFNRLSTQFSNATVEYFIDDFTVFNVYRHNSNEYTVNTSSLLQIAPIRFNIYSNSFRQWTLS